jgi:hypothetical protein
VGGLHRATPAACTGVIYIKVFRTFQTFQGSQAIKNCDILICESAGVLWLFSLIRTNRNGGNVEKIAGTEKYFDWVNIGVFLCDQIWLRSTYDLRRAIFSDFRE